MLLKLMNTPGPGVGHRVKVKKAQELEERGKSSLKTKRTARYPHQVKEAFLPRASREVRNAAAPSTQKKIYLAADLR